MIKVAPPLRLREAARWQVADAPTRLVFLPADGEIAAQEMQYAFASGGLGIAGIERAGAPKAGERLVEAAEILEREAEIEMCGRESRGHCDGAAVCGFGIGGATGRAQRVAEIGQRLDIVGFERGGVAEAVDGLVKPLQLAKYDADRDGFWSAEARNADYVARIMIRVGGEPQLQSWLSPFLMVGFLVVLLVVAVWYRLVRARTREPGS